MGLMRSLPSGVVTGGVGGLSIGGRGWFWQVGDFPGGFVCSGVGFRACGAPYFLLLRQKKVSKEKATLVDAPLRGVPCATRLGRGLRNSALWASDSPRPFSRCALRCSTTQRAGGKPCGDQLPTTEHAPFGVRSPFGRRRATEYGRGPSARTVRVLAQPERVPQPPGYPNRAGHPRRGRRLWGRFFSGDVLFAIKKKVGPHVRRGNQRRQIQLTAQDRPPPPSRWPGLR